MKLWLVALIGSLFVLVGVACAHDLYLTSEPHGQICAGVGENFPRSENAVTADRLNSFAVLNRAGSRIPLQGKVLAKQLCALSQNDGPFLAEMTVQPRFIKLPAADFNAYIHGEGLASVEQIRATRGENSKEGRELYSRYSKLIVGSDPALATTVLGHALEIVPDRAPSELKSGDTLTVRVLFKGKPLADAQVSASYAGASLEGHSYPVSARTDADGKATLKLDRSGLWYVRLIFMEPAENDPEVDWRSYFATLTFEVPAPKVKQ